ncbi:MAG: penicillin-binding protein 2 [Coriobacteriia bacterium]|nr:penicillin-binding protein 2 [Coriobacteriia bacterium]
MSRSRRVTPDNGRHAVLMVAFVIAFALLAVRLAWIQVVEAPAYAERATSQRMRDIELSPRRGTIYDREGEPLAVSVEAKTVFASPRQISDLPGAVEVLATTLGGKPSDYEELLTKGGSFVYIQRKVDLTRATELEELVRENKIEGIGFIDDFRRMYPSGELACQVLGFVGVDNDGLAGIESQYDDLLRGTPGVILGERDPQGRPIPGGIQKTIEPQHGQDIMLTIDKDIQYQAQVSVTEAVKKWGAQSGSVLVIDPRNGEILAMATAPGFDPNKYGQAKAQAIRNKPLTDSYEPGSTLKCLTTAAVIEEGLFKPNSELQLPPTLRVGGRTIKEAHPRAAVRWSLTKILTESSNVGTVKIGMKLGEEGLYKAFSEFGLTQTPGTDFPGTTKGWLPPTDQWSPTSIANIPFGQGVSVTPMQLARAIGGIANRGIMSTPHFLLAVPNRPDATMSWPQERAISAKTAQTVTGMLELAVTEGTGEAAAVRGYRVAGKTGTAQKARADGRGYKGGGYVGSFIGYLPAEDPQLLVCVTIDRPTNAIYGGVVAGPTFSKVAAFSMAHLKIPPSSQDSTDDAGVGRVSEQPAHD